VAEIIEEFEREVYGRIPSHVPKVKWEVTATEKQTVGDVPVAWADRVAVAVTDELGGILLRFRLLSAAVAVGLALAATPFLPYTPEVKVGLLIGLAGAFFQSIGRFPHAFFQVRLRMDVTAFLESAYRLAIVLLVVIVAGLDLGFYAVLMALTFAAFAWCLTSFLLSRRFWKINVRMIPGTSRPLIRDSFGLWVFTIFGLLHLQGDMVLLSLMKPAWGCGKRCQCPQRGL